MEEMCCVDHNSTVIVSYNYDAWGNTQVTLNNNYTIAHGETVLTASDIHSFNGFTYRGYYYDKDISLYYLINRYYDPTTGRFISADDTQYLDFGTFYGHNRYCYCLNNPVMGYDPTGTFIAAAVLYFTPIGGILTQLVVSACSYALASILALGDLVFNGGKGAWTDMCNIEWNLFNEDATKAADANCLSFYQGVPVFMVDSGLGSLSLGAIFIDTKNHKGNVDVLKHERGHSTQLMSMGLGNYIFQIGIPSILKNDQGSPWELSASMLGGSSIADYYSEEQKNEAYNYYKRAMIPYVNIYNIIQCLYY